MRAESPLLGVFLEAVVGVHRLHFFSDGTSIDEFLSSRRTQTHENDLLLLRPSSKTPVALPEVDSNNFGLGESATALSWN